MRTTPEECDEIGRWIGGRLNLCEGPIRLLIPEKGVSALDKPFDSDHHSDFMTDDDELSARVRDALRADSSTTQYADQVRIVTRGATVILRGRVDDLEDTDNLVAVAQYVEGIDEVIDDLRVRSLDRRG